MYGFCSRTMATERPMVQPAPEDTRSPEAAAATDPSSITIRPEAGRVEVRLPAMPSERAVRLVARLTGESEARLSTSGDAPPRYAVMPGAISIEGEMPDEVVIEIPRWVEKVIVAVGGTTVIEKRPEGLVLTADGRRLAPALEVQLTR